MKLRNLTLIKLAGLVLAAVLHCWLSTLRVRVLVADGRVHPTDPAVERFIYAFWHESLLAPAALKAQVHVLISHHVDGELIAQICRHLRIGVVRGSTSRGGAQAVLKMVELLQDSHICITPDGPRGPRRTVQMGTVFLAGLTDVPIIPVGIGFTCAWRAGSWDRFALPVPFSTVVGVLGCPVVVESNLNRERLEQSRKLLQEQMLRLTETAEQWAAAK